MSLLRSYFRRTNIVPRKVDAQRSLDLNQTLKQFNAENDLNLKQHIRNRKDSFEIIRFLLSSGVREAEFTFLNVGHSYPEIGGDIGSIVQKFNQEVITPNNQKYVRPSWILPREEIGKVGSKILITREGKGEHIWFAFIALVLTFVVFSPLGMLTLAYLSIPFIATLPIVLRRIYVVQLINRQMKENVSKLFSGHPSPDKFNHSVYLPCREGYREDGYQGNMLIYDIHNQRIIGISSEDDSVSRIKITPMK